jgi:hypothetical protein
MKFFEIKEKGKSPMIMATKNGWADLIPLVCGAKNKEEVIISPIGFWRFIKIVICGK